MRADDDIIIGMVIVVELKIFALNIECCATAATTTSLPIPVSIKMQNNGSNDDITDLPVTTATAAVQIKSLLYASRQRRYHRYGYHCRIENIRIGHQMSCYGRDNDVIANNSINKNSK